MRNKCAIAITMVLAFTVGLPVTPVIAGSTGISDDTNAKLARVKATSKRNAGSRAQAGRDAASESAAGNPAVGECGSINIANTVTEGNVGNFNQETIVVIDGDIINANNECKK